MSKPEFTIVSGVPRSGTSMQMQTLKALGFEMAGEEYPQLNRLKKLVEKHELPTIDVEGLEEHLEGPVVDDDGNVVCFKINDKFYAPDSHDMLKRLAHAKDMNPKGFYEISGAVMRGVQDPDIIRGKGVKIIVAGLPERIRKRKRPVVDEEAKKYFEEIKSEEDFIKLKEDIESGKIQIEDKAIQEKVLAGKPFQMDEKGEVVTEIKEIKLGTNPDIISKAKIVLCLRDPRNVAISQKKLQGNIELATEGGFKDANALMPANPTRYAAEMGQFCLWLLNEKPEINFLKVDYDDMHDKTEETIDRVIEFLEIDPTPEQRQEAIGNVSSNLRRSLDFKGWDEKVKEAGELATRIYRYFRLGAEDEGLEEDIKAFLKNQALRGSFWVDTEFGLWTRSNPVFHGQLLSNVKGLRDKKVEYYKKMRGQSFCEHFSRSEETYTIERPREIGDLTRRKVACGKDGEDQTIEHCYFCYHKGFLF